MRVSEGALWAIGSHFSETASRILTVSPMKLGVWVGRNFRGRAERKVLQKWVSTGDWKKAHAPSAADIMRVSTFVSIQVFGTTSTETTFDKATFKLQHN